MSIDSDALPSGTRVLLANFGVNPQFFASVAERITVAAMGSGLDDHGKQKLVDIAVSEDMSRLTQPRHVE
eukprot:1144513-Rhodomonas_salina.1